MNISRDNYEAFFLDYIEGNLRAELHEELQLFLQSNPDLAAELEEMKSFGMQNDFVSAEEIIFSNKDILKQSETSTQEDLIDELLAKEMEGDLTKEETAWLDKVALGSSVVEKWRKLFALTKLKAGNELFADKDVVRIPETIDHSSIHELLIAHCEGDLTAEENLILESLLASDSNLRTELSLYSLTRIKPDETVYPNKSSLYRKESVIIPLRRIYYGIAAAASVALLIAVINYTDKSSALTVASHTPRVELKPAIGLSDKEAQIAQDNKRQESNPTNSIVNAINNDVAIAVEPKKKNSFEEKNKTQPSITSPQQEAVVLHTEYLKSIEAENFATLTPNGLEYKMPEMKGVYEKPLDIYRKEEESTTLFAYLGKVASTRLLGSQAFVDTERQFEMLAGKVNEKFKFERVPLEKKDELILKIGRLEFRRKVSQREKINQASVWEKVKGVVKKSEE